MLVTACFCIINGTRYEEGEVISRKDEFGVCIVTKCVNATEVTVPEVCTTSVPTTTSVTITTTVPTTTGTYVHGLFLPSFVFLLSIGKILQNYMNNLENLVYCVIRHVLLLVL